MAVFIIKINKLLKLQISQRHCRIPVSSVMHDQCRGIAEHGSEGIGEQTLVGIAIELSLEVVQAVDAI